MRNGMPRGPHKSVDTFPVALLGFSLISILVVTYSAGYTIWYSALNSPEFFPEISAEDTFVKEATEELLIYMFVLPQTISVMLWYVMPSFIKDWYTLRPLPRRYRYLHGVTRRMASKMGISPPALLYTQKNVANCFNLGKREGQSTIVVSSWLLHHLDSEELEAALAHEMAHAKNRDVTLMAYFLAAEWVILLSPFFILCGISNVFSQFGFLQFDFLFYPEFWILITPFFLIFVFLILGIRWFSRLREAAADARTGLYVDKNILKRMLYKLALAQSVRMTFVSSSLMLSSKYKFGGIFSTHPSLKKRFENISKSKYIIDINRPFSFRFYFTSAVSLFIFTQLANYVFSALFFLIVNTSPPSMFLLVFNPVIVAVILVLYYDYMSRRYLALIIFLVSLLQVAIPLVTVLPFSLIVHHPILQAIEEILPEVGTVIKSATADLFQTTVDLVTQAGQFFIVTLLITLFLRYIKQYVKFQKCVNSV